VSRVHCAECEQYLGQLAPSAVGMKGHALVWHIEPGWTWRLGVLVREDYTYQAERRFLHEMTGRERAAEGIKAGRECDLPLRVRCPKCRTTRWITRDLIFQRRRRAS
jgi:hypothetical protein